MIASGLRLEGRHGRPSLLDLTMQPKRTTVPPERESAHL